jgi:hypothetical protein
MYCPVWNALAEVAQLPVLDTHPPHTEGLHADESGDDDPQDDADAARGEWMRSRRACGHDVVCKVATRTVASTFSSSDELSAMRHTECIRTSSTSGDSWTTMNRAVGKNNTTYNA